MKAIDIEADSFTIVSDDGQMIGNATISDRKWVEVNEVQTYGADYRPDDVSKMRVFSEAEARRLGLLDD